MNNNELSEEKSAEILGQIQNVQITEEEAIELFGKESVDQSKAEWAREHKAAYINSDGEEVWSAPLAKEYAEKQSKLQVVYNGSYNHALGDEHEEYKIKEKLEDGTIREFPFDEAWLVSDDPEVVRMSQQGFNEAQELLNNLETVNGINK